MVLGIAVSLVAMEFVIFVFGVRSYARHEPDGKHCEAQDIQPLTCGDGSREF